MKSSLVLASSAFLAFFASGCSQPTVSQSADSQTTVSSDDSATVFFSKEISPEALVRIYEALGRKAEGRIGVKISTGELGGHNYLKPELIGQLVSHVGGSIIECNTA